MKHKCDIQHCQKKHLCYVQRIPGAPSHNIQLGMWEVQDSETKVKQYQKKRKKRLVATYC